MTKNRMRIYIIVDRGRIAAHLRKPNRRRVGSLAAGVKRLRRSREEASA
jgi:hypothetical protein